MAMDMGSSMTMSMPSASSTMSSMASMAMSSTGTASAAAATSSAAMDMGGMDMGMGGSDPHACKISMLWNWYTVDACFLSSQWHVRSSGMFAGSCIGVMLLVMVLEALRRASREYDAYIVRQHAASNPAPAAAVRSESDSDNNNNKNKNPAVQSEAVAPCQPRSFKPSVVQQVVRATLHMCQFAVAYIIMLLAMYFNGYIIICIFIGAFLGAFVFSWHSMSLPGGEQREITYCCG